jgi:hypothetical protein
LEPPVETNPQILNPGWVWYAMAWDAPILPQPTTKMRIESSVFNEKKLKDEQGVKNMDFPHRAYV